MVDKSTTWINHEGSVVIVTKVSASTVYTVVITEGAERDIKAFRIIEFLKEFKQLSNKQTHEVAQQMLLSPIINCTSSAKKELKEIIMENQANIRPIIVVTRTAEFVGRFVDGKTASAVASLGDLIITSAEQFEQFSKTQLVSQLPTEDQPTEVQLKNITKAQIATKLFEYLTTKELKIVMSENTNPPEGTTTKVIKPKAESNMSKIIARLENGEVLTCAALAEEFESTVASIASILSNIQSEKYMKDRATISVVSGRIDGITSYVHADHADTVVFDEKKAPTAKAKKDGEPRKKGLKTLVRELLLEGPKTMDELLEATSVEKKLISDCLAYLKNPKYCGSEGALIITRDNDTKAYSAEVAAPSVKSNEE